jgi:hypothetical protein
MVGGYQPRGTIGRPPGPAAAADAVEHQVVAQWPAQKASEALFCRQYLLRGKRQVMRLDLTRLRTVVLPAENAMLRAPCVQLRYWDGTVVNLKMPHRIEEPVELDVFGAVVEDLLTEWRKLYA